MFLRIDSFVLSKELLILQHELISILERCRVIIKVILIYFSGEKQHKSLEHYN